MCADVITDNKRTADEFNWGFQSVLVEQGQPSKLDVLPPSAFPMLHFVVSVDGISSLLLIIIYDKFLVRGCIPHVSSNQYSEFLSYFFVLFSESLIQSRVLKTGFLLKGSSA